MPGRPTPLLANTGWLAAWLGIAGRLALATAALLTVQENLERLAVRLATAPDPLLLVSAAYPWALGVIAAVSLGVGLVVTLFRRRRDALLARIRAARRHAPASSDRRPNVVDPRPIASLLGTARALRAPPLALRS